MKLSTLARHHYFIFLLGIGFISPTLSANDKAAAAESSSVARLDAFTVNLAGFERYLQTTISLQVQSPEVAAKIKEWMPKIRHELILILSNQNASDIQSLQGKKELIRVMKIALNQVLTSHDNAAVMDIFLETFIIQ